MTAELCKVTVWARIAPRYNGGRGERVINTRPCGEPAVRWDLCWKHARDKERLS